MPEPWDVKLVRADEHLAELARSIRQLLGSGDIATVLDATGRERAVRLVLRAEIPARLSAIVGDIVHNTRSSLDCLALAVCEVGHGGALPDSDERKVQFPITDSEPDFDEWVRRRLPHARTDHVDFIRSRQPWYMLDLVPHLPPARRASGIEHHELNTLADLSNVDKHRRLHLAGWYPDDLYAGQPNGITLHWRPGSDPWVDGAVIGWWVLDGPDAETIALDAHAAVEIALQRHLDLRWHGIGVHGFLKRLVEYVRGWVVVPLAREIGRA